MKAPYRMQAHGGLGNPSWQDMGEKHQFETLKAASNALTFLSSQPLGEGRFRVVDWMSGLVVAPASMSGAPVDVPYYQLECQIVAGNGAGRRWVKMASGADLDEMKALRDQRAAVDPTETGPFAWRVFDLRANTSVGPMVAAEDPKGGERCLEMATDLKKVIALYVKASKLKRLSRRLEVQREAELALTELAAGVVLLA